MVLRGFSDLVNTGFGKVFERFFRGISDLFNNVF
jgi:hypothetical protein